MAEDCRGELIPEGPLLIKSVTRRATRCSPCSAHRLTSRHKSPDATKWPSLGSASRVVKVGAQRSALTARSAVVRAHGARPADGGAWSRLLLLEGKAPFAPPGCLPGGGITRRCSDASHPCVARSRRNGAMRQQPDGLTQKLTTAPFGGHDARRARVRLVPSSPWRHSGRRGTMSWWPRR